MKRLLIVSAFAVLLSGCVVGGENARHDMDASKAAYKTCLAGRGPEACESQRQAYEADISAYRATPKFVIGAGSPPPLPASGMGTMPALAHAGPPPLPPLPDMRPSLLVPGGGGTLMGFGGGAPQIMVPAGGGAFMALP